LFIVLLTYWTAYGKEVSNVALEEVKGNVAVFDRSNWERESGGELKKKQGKMMLWA